MKKLLLVIDVQKSFINEYTNGFIKRIEDLINSNKFDDIVFTKFINSTDSIWYKKLNYKGCITEEQ